MLTDDLTEGLPITVIADAPERSAVLFGDEKMNRVAADIGCSENSAHRLLFLCSSTNYSVFRKDGRLSLNFLNGSVFIEKRHNLFEDCPEF